MEPGCRLTAIVFFFKVRAQEYVTAQCKSLGYTPANQVFSGGGMANLKNLVCVKKGALDPDGSTGIVVVGAHYDTMDYQASENTMYWAMGVWFGFVGVCVCATSPRVWVHPCTSAQREK